MRFSSVRRSVALSLTVASLGLIASSATGCSSNKETGMSSNDIRTLKPQEALDDFDQVAASFRALYGAMERKQQRYGFNFEQLVSDYRTKMTYARTEGEMYGVLVEFVSRFEDPHVSLERKTTDDASQGVWLPIAAQPVENSFIVYYIDPTASDAVKAQVKMGDEITAIDGQPAADLVAAFGKYFTLANPLASKWVATSFLTSRASYLPILPADPTKPATVHLKSADGTEKDVSIPWNLTAHLLSKAPQAPATGMSAGKSAMAFSEIAFRTIRHADDGTADAGAPYFFTAASKATLPDLTVVKPSADSLAKVKLAQADADKITYYAATYTLNGKKVLFLRLPSYEPDNVLNALEWIQALFDTYQPQVDALVFDETQNPGGEVDFAQAVVSLLSKGGQYNDYVEQVHADRKWIESLQDESTQIAAAKDQPDADLFFAQSKTVESAYDANKTLSAPIPFVTGSNTGTADDFSWRKPSMMLIDENSVSCADFVPLLVKANKMATLFGQTTMGGGGNVEQVATLNNTQAVLKISRGLATVFDPTGAYPEENEIEDNGIKPDVFYSNTVADVRAGYLGYVAAMNAALLDTIAKAPPPAAPTPTTTSAPPATPTPPVAKSPKPQ